MKFELKPYHRNISKTEIHDDIQKVAKQLNKTAITAADYRQYGTFSRSVAIRRFGSWSKALEEAGLGKPRNLTISAEECISDLKEVAKRLGKNAITVNVYEENGKYTVNPFVRHFGTWFKALEVTGLERTRTLHVSDEEYFENLEEMWVTLGRQPSCNDVQKPFSKYSAGAYEYRFGTWRKALEAFVLYVNEGASENSTLSQKQTITPSVPSEDNSDISLRKPSRSISWRLRFLVMRRDNFKCRACGRSPALQPGLVLHIDHVKAWIKGGETIMENLQTLCEQCNIGKSDLPMMEKDKG